MWGFWFVVDVVLRFGSRFLVRTFKYLVVAVSKPRLRSVKYNWFYGLFHKLFKSEEELMH